MGIHCETLHSLGQLNATRPVAAEFECFADQGNDFSRQKTTLLCRDRARKTQFGKSVHVFARNLIRPGNRFRGFPHGDARSGIEQRFPQEILELHLAHAKATAMSKSSDRIAAHGFRTDAKTKFDLL